MLGEEGFVRFDNVWVVGLVLEETNSIEIFAANQDVGRSGELVALALGQVGAVDNPVVVHAAVETVLFAQAVCNHFSHCVFFT